MSKLSPKLADRASLEHRNQDSVSRLEKLGSSSPAAAFKNNRGRGRRNTGSDCKPRDQHHSCCCDDSLIAFSHLKAEYFSIILCADLSVSCVNHSRVLIASQIPSGALGFGLLWLVQSCSSLPALLMLGFPTRLMRQKILLVNCAGLEHSWDISKKKRLAVAERQVK